MHRNLHRCSQSRNLRTPAVDVGVAIDTPTPTAGARGRARHREVPRTSREQPSKAQGVGRQQPMPEKGGDRCPHEPRRRGLDQCGASRSREQPAAGAPAVAAVGSLRTSQRAAFQAQGNGLSQMRADRVRGHQSPAAGMLDSRWGFRWGFRRPTVSGGEALCEEHGAVGRRQAV